MWAHSLGACSSPSPESAQGPGQGTGQGAGQGAGQGGSDLGVPSMMARQQCVPGIVERCDCGPGQLGISTCDSQGVSLGPCQCALESGLSTGDGSAAGGASSAAGSGAGSQSAPDLANGTAPDVSGAPDGADVTAGGSPAGREDTLPPPDLRARDLRISEISIYQAVKVALVQDGEPVIARNAPVIVGKAAFFRVAVEPLQGFSPREIEVELTLSSAEGAVMPQVVRQRVSGPSSDAALESTINFDIPAEAVTADLRYAVELREVSEPGAGAGMVDPDVRFPREPEQTEPLGARTAGPLRVMIVPYRYLADGSGRLPVIDDTQLQLFRDYLYAYYPINEIEFEMHEPVDYNQSVNPNTGWEQWLDFHCDLRTNESPDPKLLYYGLIAPRESLRAYGGGVVGISYLPGPAANFGRCSVGVGFEGSLAATTMSHELGHSLGLPHAPCGVDGGPFPYAEAKIGVWGYGLSSRTLKDPDQFYDLMSYCDPIFISDYNFQKLFERVRYLNLQFSRTQPSTPQAYVRVLALSDGSYEVRGRSMFQQVPGGDEEARSVRLLRADGGVGAERTGYFFPVGEGDGGVWLVPDTGAAAVELEPGVRVRLR